MSGNPCNRDFRVCWLPCGAFKAARRPSGMAHRDRAQLYQEFSRDSAGRDRGIQRKDGGITDCV